MNLTQALFDKHVSTLLYKTVSKSNLFEYPSKAVNHNAEVLWKIKQLISDFVVSKLRDALGFHFHFY